MNTTRSALVIALVLAMVTGSPAAADPRDDKERIDAEVAKASAMLETATDRAKQAASLYASTTTALPGAQTRAAEARGQVAAAATEVKAAHRELAAAEATQARAQAALADAKEQVEQARDGISGFVAAAYKGGGVAALNMLVEADSPVDLANRLGYLDFVVGSRRAALDQMVVARLAAKEASNRTVVAERAARTAAEHAAQALDAAEAERALADDAAADLVALTSQRKQALAVAAEEREESIARYEELKKQSARIAAELRDWEAQQAQLAPAPAPPQQAPAPAPPQQAPVQRPARLLMPVHGWKSSDFGMRFDPFYGVWQLHAGVDIAAGGGQPIHAAEAGKVIRASWYGGYGNYTCLYHGAAPGGSLATCYAHQSQILVDVNQRVRRGQLIGRVGTTGASTGYHLHFEVRLSGDPVNPLSWLPGCLC